MKRLFCLLICCAMMASLCACSPQQEEFVDPIKLYYLQIQPQDHIHHGSADSIIAPEIREGYRLRNQTTLLLDTYLTGPATEFCRSPFPAGTRLIGFTMDGKKLSVTLSDEIAQLGGIELILACACLSRTCLELWDFDEVQIMAETAQLDGKAMIIMNKTNYLLTDDTVAYLYPEE